MSRPSGRKVGDSRLPRKTSKESPSRPYRKPTQVDGDTRITHLENRVQTNEKVLEGKASHDDMESVHVSLDRLERNLSEDVRELRRTLQTVFGISAKEYRQFDKP